MNKRLRGVVLLLLIAFVGLALSGCPGKPQFEVSPATITFGAEHGERRLTLTNLGSRPEAWTLEMLTREDEASPWNADEVPWLNISKRSGTLPPGVEHITLTVSRTQLRPGVYSNTALRVRVTRTDDEHIIPISLIVTFSLSALL